ncbi:DUF3939 domain-containing protein [Bacillus sp. H-16]|uniref:DUF3939 domain-containing protein n=1 Tax=Alteribacter salitolerans TaxID=2912333 RepID=UPI0019654996|nr:DUF3939 domain-containing protein [Alteribacter salitolerans]MBM7097753.1 DUF3939 domain-containing protein [Alteribacter salitolerans]
MWFKRKKGGNNRKKKPNVETKPVTIEEMRSAINQYAKQLNPDVSLRTIVKDNHEVDSDVLIEQLNCKPDRPFYMSKETFEIFEEADYPKWIDLCQVACDQYFLEKDEEPVTPGDSTRKVNYLKIRNYMKDEPPFQLYLHPQDRMVTHRVPEK